MSVAAVSSSRTSSAGQSSTTANSTVDAALNEYFVSVDIFLSKSAAATHKPQLGPKRGAKPTEKRDSLKNSPSFNDLHARKIKEKASWLSLSRTSAGTEQWRHATCKLVEDENQWTLKVYLEESTLYQTVHINQLRHADIRQVHRSLFDRKDCLGIFCAPEAAFTFHRTTDPLYLAFADTDLLHIWLALLRSCAIPEAYGYWLSPKVSNPAGGLYRMWRQIELVCIQGRNLGTSRLPEELGDPEYKQEDPVDIDVYCEIYLNGCLSGRTTIKKGLGSPDWQEKFMFLDLPPFGALEIIVWRDKKLTKPVMVGSTTIALMNFRRREYVDGWFPVLSAQHHAGIVVGEIRLKMKVDEEIILPQEEYAGVLKCIAKKNCLDWVTELDSRYEVRYIVQEHFFAIARAQNTLANNIMDLADREIEGTSHSHQTLFRASTNFTRMMEIYMHTYGATLLEASVGGLIRRICAEKVVIETDPTRSRKSGRALEKNVELLVHWCQEFWKSIYDARKHCPAELRDIFAHIRTLIEVRFKVHEGQHTDLPWQGISSFLFLRFFVPTILKPHDHGIWHGMPDELVSRSLTLIAKVLLSLANLNVTIKDDHLRTVKDFLSTNSSKMVKYLDAVSSDSSNLINGQRALPSSQRHERKRLMNVVKQRNAREPHTLNREAVPMPPQMIDLPRHLAVVSSVVVRHTRRTLPTRTGAAAEQDFDVFCQQCLEIEENALRRVSTYASLGKSRRKLSSTGGLEFAAPESPISPRSTRQRDRKTSQGEGKRTSPRTDARVLRKRSPRASSVPPPASSEASHSPSTTTSHLPMSRAQSQELPRPEAASLATDSSTTLDGSVPRPIRPSLGHHTRSTSTDSALFRNKYSLPTSSSAPVTYLTADRLASELEEEASRRKKGLLRSFRRK